MGYINFPIIVIFTMVVRMSLLYHDMLSVPYIAGKARFVSLLLCCLVKGASDRDRVRYGPMYLKVLNF